MDMPMSAPSHTIATFYQMLLIEALILIVFVVALTVVAVFWKRHGKAIKAEMGIETVDRTLRWQASTQETHRLEKIPGRRILVIGLGLLWIADGLLQAQPALGTNFLQDVIQPVMDGQPQFLLNNFLDITSMVFSSAPLWMDSLTVWIQLLLGIGILFGPERAIGRVSLRLSIVWGLIVWVFGEALGQILTGGTWLTGAPGSVLVYIVMAVLLLMPYSSWLKGTVHEVIAWTFGIYWLCAAVLQALPSAGFWNPGGLSNELLPMAQMNQPAWMARPLFDLAYAVIHGAAWWNGAFVAIPLLLGVVWFIQPKAKWGVWLTVVAVFLSWWLCQDFGVIGGAGTDPNTGAPLLILLLSTIGLPTARLTPWQRVQTWMSRRP